MGIWETLGIEPTNDIKAIKAAYAAAARLHNPEDEPEIFKEIYSAYKSACAYAKLRRQVSENSGKTDNTPDDADCFIPTDFPSIDENTPSDDAAPPEPEEPAFCFDGINDKLDAVTLTPAMLRGYFIDKLRAMLDDPDMRDDKYLWREIFNSEEFEKVQGDPVFRQKAAELFSREYLPAEAASAVASGFGIRSKAVCIDMPRHKWQVLISDGTGRPPDGGYKLPSYLDNGKPTFFEKALTWMLSFLIIGIAALLLVGTMG